MSFQYYDTNLHPGLRGELRNHDDNLPGHCGRSGAIISHPFVEGNCCVGTTATPANPVFAWIYKDRARFLCWIIRQAAPEMSLWLTPAIPVTDSIKVGLNPNQSCPEQQRPVHLRAQQRRQFDPRSSTDRLEQLWELSACISPHPREQCSRSQLAAYRHRTGYEFQ